MMLAIIFYATYLVYLPTISYSQSALQSKTNEVYIVSDKIVTLQRFSFPLLFRNLTSEITNNCSYPHLLHRYPTNSDMAPPPPPPPPPVSAISIPQPDSLLSQLKLYDMILSISKPMALRAAVLLNIPDIIAEASGSLTLEEIAAHISASTKSPPSIEYLFRLLRFLASDQVFSEIPHEEDFKQCRYALTAFSKLLVQETSKGGLSSGVPMQNYVPLLLGATSHVAFQAWMHLHESVLDGGYAFGKAFGMSSWDYTSNNPEANKIFNEAVSCDTRAVMASVVSVYEEGFKKITSLVDVGGGVGSALSIIVENYKHIRGINFDLPHVIASALPIAGKIDLNPEFW